MSSVKHLLLVALVSIGCGKSSSLPKLTPALMPPSASPLVLGASTEADLIAKLGPAKPATPEGREREISRDKQFGGEGQVQFNEHASIRINEPGVGEFYLWADGGRTPVLGRFDIKAPEGCAWLKDNVAKLDGARSCPGNRKTGVTGDNGYVCMQLDDGRVVHAECSTNSISYWIGKKR
jgi:hypothetical protein